VIQSFKRASRQTQRAKASTMLFIWKALPSLRCWAPSAQSNMHARHARSVAVLVSTAGLNLNIEKGHAQHALQRCLYLSRRLERQCLSQCLRHCYPVHHCVYFASSISPFEPLIAVHILLIHMLSDQGKAIMQMHSWFGFSIPDA